MSERQVGESTGKRFPRARKTLNALVPIAFIALIIWLLRERLADLDPQDVWAALRDLAPVTLLAAIALTALSYCIYVGYEWMARLHLGHRVPRRRVAATAFVSYVFNLNFSSFVGAMAVRYRLYRQWGLERGMIVGIFAFASLTNWIGYFAVGGLILLVNPPEIPMEWGVSATLVRVVGGGLFAVALTYFGFCARMAGRKVKIRSFEVQLPALRIALLQAGIAGLNWVVIASIQFAFLPIGIDWHQVVAVSLFAAIAALLSHIPGGLGVLEAVFLAAFTPAYSPAGVLAGILAFRAVYYLLPLVFAVPLYFAMEIQAGRRLVRGGPLPHA